MNPLNMLPCKPFAAVACAVALAGVVGCSQDNSTAADAERRDQAVIAGEGVRPDAEGVQIDVDRDVAGGDAVAKDDVRTAINSRQLEAMPLAVSRAFRQQFPQARIEAVDIRTNSGAAVYFISYFQNGEINRVAYDRNGQPIQLPDQPPLGDGRPASQANDEPIRQDAEDVRGQYNPNSQQRVDQVVEPARRSEYEGDPGINDPESD